MDEEAMRKAAMLDLWPVNQRRQPQNADANRLSLENVQKARKAVELMKMSTSAGPQNWEACLPGDLPQSDRDWLLVFIRGISLKLATGSQEVAAQIANPRSETRWATISDNKMMPEQVQTGMPGATGLKDEDAPAAAATTSKNRVSAHERKDSAERVGGEEAGSPHDEVLSSFLEAAGLYSEEINEKSQERSETNVCYEIAVGDLSFICLLVSDRKFYSDRNILEMCVDLQKFIQKSNARERANPFTYSKFAMKLFSMPDKGKRMWIFLCSQPLDTNSNIFFFFLPSLRTFA